MSSPPERKQHGGYGDDHIHQIAEMCKWHSLRDCTFLFGCFWDLPCGFCCHLNCSFPGVQVTRVLGTWLCLVPYGSYYIYGSYVLKFIQCPSCYIADLLYQPTLTCVPVGHRQDGLSPLWLSKEKRRKRAIFPPKWRGPNRNVGGAN